MPGKTKQPISMRRQILWVVAGFFLILIVIAALISTWADRAVIPAAQLQVPEKYRPATLEPPAALTRSSESRRVAASFTPDPRNPQVAFNNLKIKNRQARLLPREALEPDRKAALDNWLAANRAYLEELYRNIDQAPADPPADPTAAWRLKFDLMSHAKRHMLLAAGWKALGEGNDAEVQRACLALLKLSVLETRAPQLALESFLIIDRLSETLELMQAWFTRGSPDLAQMEALRPALDDTAARIFDRANLQQILKAEFERERNTVVQFCNHDSWRSTFFFVEGKDVSSSRLRAFVDIGGKTWKFPRPSSYLAASARAMKRKLRAPLTLQAFDRTWGDFIDASALPWPEFLKHPMPSFPSQAEAGWFDPYLPRRELNMVPWLVAEMRLNMMRAALDWQRHPGAAPAPETEMRLQPHHPWRDPFTERPLVLDQTTSESVIYSSTVFDPQRRMQLGSFASLMIKLPPGAPRVRPVAGNQPTTQSLARFSQFSGGKLIDPVTSAATSAIEPPQ